MSFARAAFVSVLVASTSASCVDGPDELLVTSSTGGTRVDVAGSGGSGVATAGGDASGSGGASGSAHAGNAPGGHAGGSGGEAGSKTDDGGASGANVGGTSGASGAGGIGGASGASGTSGSGDFSPAAHDPFPSFAPHNGPTFASPTIVLTGYMGDTHRADLEAWAEWVTTSSWLTSVGADYGVTSATYGGSVVFPNAPPVEISDAEIQEWLSARIADGTLAKPAPETIYLFYLPSTSVVFLGGETSCTQFGGYHASVSQGSSTFAYAVLPTCPAGQFGPTELEGLEVVASHELIEAATDPFVNDSPAWMVDTTMASSGAWPWLGSEVADLCAHQPIAFGDEWAQRVWSKSAASMGLDPCVPNPSSQPYFNASVVPPAVRMVAPGDTVVFELVGFSFEEVPDWEIDAQPKSRDFDPKLQLDASMLNNGRSVHLSVTVPTDAPSGSSAGFVLRSLRNGDTDDYTMWPMAVRVPD